MISAMSGAPVVPAAIIGTDKMFKSGSFFPKLKVIYGEPMSFTGDRKDKEQLAAFSQSIMDRIAELKSANE